MAVYFNHKLTFPKYSTATSGKGKIAHFLMEWHSKFSILAVSSHKKTTNDDGYVDFFHDEGDLIKNATIQRPVAPNCMDWHPDKKILAIGWLSGEISTYNVSERRAYDQSSYDQSPILVLKWNQSGRRIITGDRSGLILVWEMDDAGKVHPTPVLKHHLDSAVTHLVMMHPDNMAKPNLFVRRNTTNFEDLNWKPKSLLASKSVLDPINSFLTTEEGALYYLNNAGDCMERCRLDAAILALLLNCDTHLLSVVTNSLRVSQFSVTLDGQTTVTTTQVKISGGQNKMENIICSANNILASCSNENIIRCWDFGNNENFILDIQRYSKDPMEEVVTSIAYNPKNGIIAGGTNIGNVLLWKWRERNRKGSQEYSVGTTTADISEQWEFIASTSVTPPALSMTWGGMDNNLLAVNSNESVEVLSENLVSSHYGQKVSVVQINPNEAQVECHDSNQVLTFYANLHIKGICTTNENVAVWGGRKLEVYSILRDKMAMQLEGTFHTSASSVALYNSNVYCIDHKQINIRSFQGSVKQVIPLLEQEGVPACLSVTGHYLVCGTSTGHVKLWDTGRREAKLLGTTHLKVVIPGLDSILSVQSNCNGTRVSIIEQPQENSDVDELALWFVDTDSIKVFNSNFLLKQMSQEHENYLVETLYLTLPEQLPVTSQKEQRRLLMELVGRMPILPFWDPEESQLLAVEWSYCSYSLSTVDRMKLDSTFSLRTQAVTQTETLVNTFFITQEQTFLISEELSQDPSVTNLLGISMPHLYFRKKASTGVVPHQVSNESMDDTLRTIPSIVTRVTLRDFIGLDDRNIQILHAMIEFSYYSAVGNMDGAYKSIKLIKNQAVWESMARMCVKTQRLDVALMCLGNMGNARAAGAVRQAMDIPEIDARLAILAVELGMLGDAEYLFKRSKRYDLLNEFYQLSAQWEKAMEVAETKDRLHLKNTYYAYARYAEEAGDSHAAIKSYEKSNTHQFEVPRMLLDTGELEEYVLQSQDRGICKWWAEYLESMGEWEQAMQCYDKAQDYYSLVRILCFNGQLDRAAEIAEESGCKVASYHLARRLNVANQDPRRTIHFFVKAQCYSPAIQIAKEHKLDGELVHLSLLSTQEDMLDSARYYEENTKEIDKAILLYHKAGEIAYAVDMCFHHNHFEMLDQIAEDLTESTDPELTQKVADYFMDKGLFAKALEILLRNQRTEEALKLCSIHNVPLSEELVEKMTIPRRESETAEETAHRVLVLEKLADCCLSMGAYHIAAKKFTQAGNPIKALKALLKSGDTQKIIFFAGVSRQKDIYVMAANYLQTLDWRKDHTILTNIISFYTKGRALESLAGFYDACAQDEIDECQDYPKAVGALEQAIKVISKVKGKDPTTIEAKISFFQARMDVIKRFLEVRSLYTSDPEKSMKICQEMLEDRNLDVAIRVGDVYGLMIEHYAKIGNHKQASLLIGYLKQRVPNVILNHYIDNKTIKDIHSALGEPPYMEIAGDQLKEKKSQKFSGLVVEEELEVQQFEEDEELDIDA